MKQSVIRQLTAILLLSILIVKTAVCFVPFVIAFSEEANLTELMLEQKEGKESAKETSVKEYLESKFAFEFLDASLSLSDIVIAHDASFNRSFFPSILTPPPNC